MGRSSVKPMKPMKPTKPYLLSIGIGLPMFGVWMHRYIPVNKKHFVRSRNKWGIHIVWTNYKRIEKVQ